MNCNFLELIFTVDNKTLMATGDKRTDLHVLSQNGLETMEFSRQIHHTPAQDGGKLIHSTGDIRKISFEFLGLVANRQNYMEFFSYLKNGLLSVTYEGTTREINYTVERFKQVDEHFYPSARFQIELVCFNPFFRSLDDFGNNLADKRYLHGFPFMWFNQQNKGNYGAEYYVNTNKTELKNNGHVPCGFTCRIKARDTVLNPNIKNMTNGGNIKVLYELKEGDFIDIISHANLPPDIEIQGLESGIVYNLVILNGNYNITNRTDITQTTFFKLETGINQFSYTADTGIDNMEIFPYFNTLYFGV